ncbi:MAG: tyrosine-type recombinase/integrase [Gemmatimonadetes bacterium]|nr:tyrosine-type recombinase/integrase [Gemmatimonadota bacterium]MYG16777.1 tyrosine-type recombinase/integrase [Gemmatimonadota bacterium]
MRKLNARECRSTTKPGFYRVDDTLYLYVKPSGRKSWVQRVVIDGRRHNLGLGSFPVVSLDKAKRRAFENRVKISDGVNPLRGSVPTFREAAEKVHVALAPSFRSEQHTRDWMRILKKHAYPAIENVPVDRIKQQHVMDLLKPIWTTKTETARRVRQRIKTVLDHCRVDGHVRENVADDRLNPALPSMPKVKENFRALDFREMPDAVNRIRSVSSLPARLCMLFAVYTAARSNEVREATWDEIDEASSTWEIPGERMKNGKPHRVPLSKSALEVLKDARPLRNDSNLIFPSLMKPRHPMSSRALVKNLEELGLADKTTVHGFRTSFRTWASERTDIPREVCEMALAHTVGNAVEQAYSRSDLLEKRTSLMVQWDEFLRNV